MASNAGSAGSTKRDSLASVEAFVLNLLGSQTPDHNPTLTGQPDWSLVASSATPSLHPYLAFRAERWVGKDGSVGKNWDRLRAARRGSAIIHLQRHGALRLLLGTLDSHHIPVLVLKGMALAYLVYPDPALRPMQDIDLWVPLERLDEAARALAAVGYRFPDRKYRGQSELGVSERALELPGTPILIELQGAPPSLAALPPAFTQRCWNRSRPADLGGVPARVLHPEDLLIHLCLHAVTHHRFDTGLLPVLDLRLTIERWGREWDWPAMARDYVALGIAGRMYLTLSLVRELLAAPVPEEFFSALPVPEALGEMQALARQQLWAPLAVLPRALERGLGGTTLRGRAKWLVTRFTSHYAQGLPAGGGPISSTVEVVRRVMHDLSVKIPNYVRAWVRGDLRGAEFKRRTALARGREQLADLLARAESRPRPNPLPFGEE